MSGGFGLIDKTLLETTSLVAPVILSPHKFKVKLKFLDAGKDFVNLSNDNKISGKIFR